MTHRVEVSSFTTFKRLIDKPQDSTLFHLESPITQRAVCALGLSLEWSTYSQFLGSDVPKDDTSIERMRPCSSWLSHVRDYFCRCLLASLSIDEIVGHPAACCRLGTRAPGEQGHPRRPCCSSLDEPSLTPEEGVPLCQRIQTRSSKFASCAVSSRALRNWNA